jgi:glutamate-1-semialdehyde aminotransferase
MPTVGVTYFAGTFVRHPLALAAARAVLEHLRREGPALQRRLTESTTAFAVGLNRHLQERGAPIEIRHFGSLWRPVATAEHPHGELLFPMLRDRGVHILEGFPCFFTTAHSAADIELVATAFRESVAEMQEAGFLPRRSPAATQLDSTRPPVPGARLGRDADHNPAWFVPNPEQPGRYLLVESRT